MQLYPRLHVKFPALLLQPSFDFARHTTIGCGGTSEVAAYPSSIEEAALLLAYLTCERIPMCFLGAGANVLPSDGNFEGVVVLFRRLNALCADGTEVYAGAGVTGGELLKFACRSSIGGFSPLSGIPMTVGGGVAMNAGVKDLYFSDLVRRVVCVEAGKLRTLEQNECAFGKKESIFQQGIAVLGVCLQGRYARPADIARESCYYRSKRMHLPKGRSMGCTFVNPDGATAGALIEACGLKGMRIGGAFVSEKHANFICNEGQRARDVAALIEYIKKTVEERTGIVLREEIRRLP